jgi:dipeptide transport system ATP-binding protein
MSLLRMKNLSVTFGQNGDFPAVDGMDVDINRGEIVGIVGESGSGKSVSMLALMGLIEAPGRVSADELIFNGQDLLTLSARQRRQIIGKDIAMVFQDALSSLHPSFTVGYQIKEVLKTHTSLRGSALKQRTLELLDLVEIPAAKSRLHAYPHQLSGGMNQRIMIAMAIACEPKLLIADEPTTALDVTIQAQIMELLINLQKYQQMALIMITHDLAVIAEIAQRVMVMYAGQVMESNRMPDIFNFPHHPYTAALLESIPKHNQGQARLRTLKGVVPGQHDRPLGCLLSPRCQYAQPHCHKNRPTLNRLTPTSKVSCFIPLHITPEEQLS